MYIYIYFCSAVGGLQDISLGSVFTAAFLCWRLQLRKPGASRPFHWSTLLLYFHFLLYIHFGGKC